VGLNVTGREPRRLDQLLQSGDIARLGAEAAERRALLARVQGSLPGAESLHVVSAHIDDAGQLVLGVDSAAWAAKLRYERDTLLDCPLKVRVVVPV